MVANPFKTLVKINIFIEKCAAGGSHSRPSPGLRQGPGSSDLHFLRLNLKVVGKHDPAWGGDPIAQHTQVLEDVKAPPTMGGGLGC